MTPEPKQTIEYRDPTGATCLVHLFDDTAAITGEHDYIIEFINDPLQKAHEILTAHGYHRITPIPEPTPRTYPPLPKLPDSI